MGRRNNETTAWEKSADARLAFDGVQIDTHKWNLSPWSLFVLLANLALLALYTR